MTIKEYAAPESVEQAYELLTAHPGSRLLAGLTMLKRQDLEIPLGIDLGKLGLDGIRDEQDAVVIGAMATYRQIERSERLTGALRVLADSIRDVGGPQLRNHITAGGGVALGSGYCDLLTPLLALEAELTFHHRGTVLLEEHLARPVENDILLEIRVPRGAQAASYQCVRHSQEDRCYLNAVAAQTAQGIRIAVGGQGAGVFRAKRAEELLQTSNVGAREIQQAAQLAAQELAFTADISASAQYRREICPVVVERALEAIR